MEDRHLPLELQHENHPQNHKLSILNKAAHAMTAPHDLDTALEQMIIEVKTLLAAESATIFLRPPLSSKLVVTTVATPEAKQLIGKKLPEGAGIANWALHERHPIWLENAHEHPYFYDGIDTVTGLTTRSILAVPMLFKEKPVGVIEVINKLAGQFNEHDAELVKPIAHAAAIAISNAQLTEESEHRTRQLTVLHELDQAISTSLRVNDIYNAFAQHAGRLLPYDNLAITLLDEGELRLAYQTGSIASPWSADEIVPSRNSILSWVTTHRQPLLRHDVVTTARFAEDKQLVALGIQST
ncbi:MAG: GAF domain-containing protein, partial [Anaerolineae bacterium]|nr:GAF domain-containing protein [Anaerolineae bacterium]